MFKREKLQKYMKESGKGASALAREFGVTEGAIRHIVSGIKQPSLAMTVQLADMMGCSVDELCVKEASDDK